MNICRFGKKKTKIRIIMNNYLAKGTKREMNLLAKHKPDNRICGFETVNLFFFFFAQITESDST
jgi:hypothetical protein